MNLAFRDVRHNLFRFLLTCLGLGLLMTVVLAMMDKARKQIGLFLGILLTVSAVVIALIIYTMTMEKLKQIATLKLTGAPDRVISGLIVQQSHALGGAG